MHNWHNKMLGLKSGYFGPCFIFLYKQASFVPMWRQITDSILRNRDFKKTFNMFVWSTSTQHLKQGCSLRGIHTAFKTMLLFKGQLNITDVFIKIQFTYKNPIF